MVNLVSKSTNCTQIAALPTRKARPQGGPAASGARCCAFAPPPHSARLMACPAGRERVILPCGSNTTGRQSRPQVHRATATPDRSRCNGSVVSIRTERDLRADPPASAARAHRRGIRHRCNPRACPARHAQAAARGARPGHRPALRGSSAGVVPRCQPLHPSRFAAFRVVVIVGPQLG